MNLPYDPTLNYSKLQDTFTNLMPFFFNGYFSSAGRGNCSFSSKIKINRRPHQDSNLESSEPKSDALSIRPRSQYVFPVIFIAISSYILIM